MRLHIAKEVELAIAKGEPVVALESTIISHGLPSASRLPAAIEFENLVRSGGAVPATIAVIDGIARIGLSETEIELLSQDSVYKASVRDLPVVAAKRLRGATTVAATAYLAALAGIRVFATGGLGGVHRGASLSFDESADLSTLANTPVAVVAAGVKSILDIHATLERLETLSVPVIGYQTDDFPAFWLRSSGISLDWRADSPLEIAEVMHSQDQLMQSEAAGTGLIVANPIPIDQQWDRNTHDKVIDQALALAQASGVQGKAVTPFLLQKIVELSGGKSLEVNLNLVRNNIKLAGAIATAYCQLHKV
jgi:pseudouridine-5'-phosphate glycosidase